MFKGLAREEYIITKKIQIYVILFLLPSQRMHEHGKKKKSNKKKLKNKHLESEYFCGINLKTSFFIAGVSFCAENIS